MKKVYFEISITPIFVKYSKIQRSLVKYGGLLWNTVLKNGTTQWSSLKYGEIQWSLVKNGAVALVKYGCLQCNTVVFGKNSKIQ